MPVPIPADIVHQTFACSDDGNRATFGWWLHIAGAVALDAAAFHVIVYDWVTFCQPSFLDCMARSTSFVTCRLDRPGPPVPYVHLEQIAPNVGAQPEGQPMSTTCGLYLRPAISSRGGGSRVHLPGLPQRFVDVNAKLSAYGQQQLTFAAAALTDYIARLSADLSTTVELVTLQTRRAGAPLAIATYTPTTEVVPTLRLETLGRRMRASGGFSPS